MAGKYNLSQAHNHDEVYAKIGEGGVTDHGLLTGLEDNDHPQYLLAASGKAADSDKLDGLDSTDFGRPVFLTAPLTSTSWDGDAYSSNGGKTLIDLSAVFGVPAGVKAVLLECAINDSGSLTYSTSGGAWILFSGQNDEAWAGQGISLEKEPNDAHRNAHMVVACNPDGDIYYRINASGTGTMDVILKIWGYWL